MAYQHTWEREEAELIINSSTTTNCNKLMAKIILVKIKKQRIALCLKETLNNTKWHNINPIQAVSHILSLLQLMGIFYNYLCFIFKSVYRDDDITRHVIGFSKA